MGYRTPGAATGDKWRYVSRLIRPKAIYNENQASRHEWPGLFAFLMISNIKTPNKSRTVSIDMAAGSSEVQRTRDRLCQSILSRTHFT